MSQPILAAALVDWTDVDVAAHALARSIGLMPHRSAMRDAKHVYWSDNALGNELVVLLDRLAALGFLEKRDEPDLQYRVRAEFRVELAIEPVWKRAATPESSADLALVVLRCATLEQSRKFYEGLGISFKAEQHGSGPLHYSTLLGETVLELYPAGASPSAPTRLGIRVPDVETAVGNLRVFGDFVLQFDSDKSPSWALVRDPDGNKLELTACGR